MKTKFSFPKISFSFLNIGKTKESTEGVDIKRYIGLGSSYVLAVNPDKAKLDELMGFESQNDPKYTGSDDNGQFARIHFIVRTDPDVCNGIEVTNRVMFTMRPEPAYNRDKTKVQVIDIYGNSTWLPVEDAKAGRKPVDDNGNPKKLADKYRMACVGEADLVAFLKAYLNVDDAFSYKNSTWVLKPEAQAADCVFGLEHISNYFKGDFSEIRDAVKLQPNNKVKLLYGIRTVEQDDGSVRQYQAIASRGEFVLRNSAGSGAITHLERQLANAKAAGSYSTTEFRIQDLQEFSVEPTNLEQPKQEDSSAMPWDQ